MDIFGRGRRRYEARVAGKLLADRLAMEGLFAAVSAAHPIAPALERIMADGATQLFEVGASKDCIERFAQLMQGFVAASERRG